MSPPTPTELKKTLMSEGFEIYRTLGARVLLADRVRDNLIMDSGVAAVADSALAVRFVVRAQASDFPGENPEELFDRARALTVEASGGYQEVEAMVVPIHDPGDKSKTLDTWYEVAYEKPVADLPELIGELREALALAKTVRRA